MQRTVVHIYYWSLQCNWVSTLIKPSAFFVNCDEVWLENCWEYWNTLDFSELLQISPRFHELWPSWGSFYRFLGRVECCCCCMLAGSRSGWLLVHQRSRTAGDGDRGGGGERGGGPTVSELPVDADAVSAAAPLRHRSSTGAAPDVGERSVGVVALASSSRLLLKLSRTHGGRGGAAAAPDPESRRSQTRAPVRSRTLVPVSIWRISVCCTVLSSVVVRSMAVSSKQQQLSLVINVHIGFRLHTHQR